MMTLWIYKVNRYRLGSSASSGRPMVSASLRNWPLLPLAMKMSQVFVGNLSYGMTDADLQNLFEQYGTVQSAQVIMDRDTGRSKGFGFVEMDSAEQAQAAIAALNGQEINGRALTVNEARPREERGGSRGFAGSRNGGKRY